MSTLSDNRPLLAAAALFMLATAVIVGALVFEHVLKFEPCALCYQQRWPWYAAASGGLLLALFASKGDVRPARFGLLLIGIVMLGSFAFGLWHAGIELKWWPGPKGCTGGVPLSGGLPDLSRRVVMCDRAPLRILGLSFAGWNAVLSAAAAVIAFSGLSGPARADDEARERRNTRV